MKTSTHAPLMEVRKLQKTYGEEGAVKTPVLHGIDLIIAEGEFVAIMGPSGSGKSTLMHILGFLDAPTGGTYLLSGKYTEHFNDDELARIRATRVGFVFQAFNLLSRSTVLQNVMLPLLYNPKINVNDREQCAHKAIKEVGLTHRTQYLTNQLSGGQQQRVAIARALVTQPEVIFADEPTGNLDSSSGEQVLAILQRLHKRGRTVILVTHDKRTAQHAERIIHIVDGKIDSDSRTFKRLIAFEHKDEGS